jgi:hypothetical protein
MNCEKNSMWVGRQKDIACSETLVPTLETALGLQTWPGAIQYLTGDLAIRDRSKSASSRADPCQPLPCYTALGRVNMVSYEPETIWPAHYFGTIYVSIRKVQMWSFLIHHIFSDRQWIHITQVVRYAFKPWKNLKINKWLKSHITLFFKGSDYQCNFYVITMCIFM